MLCSRLRRGRTGPQAKEHGRPPEAGGAGTDSLLGPPEGTQLPQHLDLSSTGLTLNF